MYQSKATPAQVQSILVSYAEKDVGRKVALGQVVLLNI